MVNFSMTKQKYSFSKGSRFPADKKIVNHEIGYNLPTTNQSRTCGFGIGIRFKTPMTTRDGT